MTTSRGEYSIPPLVIEVENISLAECRHDALALAHAFYDTEDVIVRLVEAEINAVARIFAGPVIRAAFRCTFHAYEL